MGGQAANVFVSYKAEDRARVQPLVAALEAEGFSVWWDTHIGGGAHWREDIQQHLDAAKCVIVVWTKRSVGPEGDFVRDEAALAKRRGVYLPVRFDAVELPLGFREVQAILLNRWHGDRSDPRFVGLCDAARECITGEHVARLHGRHVQPPISRRAIIGASAFAAAAVAGIGAWELLKPSAAFASARIAVLPFANLSGDPNQAYFAQGIAEELRAALSRIGLQVIGRNSCEAVKDLDIKSAAAKLGVANVLTGSVRRSPDTIRVDAQLVSGSDGVEHWAQTYDRAPGDAIKIQTDIAANVAQALSFALGQTARAALKVGGTNNAEAQDLLLQAMEAPARDDTEKGTLDTIALLDRALELDPGYAEAHARKAQYLEFWASQFAASVVEKERAQSEAIQSAQRAIRIAPRLSLGYGALGAIHQDQLQLRRSLGDFERADALRAEIVTLANYALVLSQALRQADAQATIQRSIRLDPFNPLAHELQSWILFLGRRFEDSAAAARRAIEIEPGRNRATTFLGNALLMLGRTDEALREFQRVPADDYHRLVGEAAVRARGGQRGEALKAIPALERRYGDSAYYQFAQVYAQAGLSAQGIEALETAWAKRDPGLSSVQADPFLDPLRKDARLSAIIARVFE